MAKHTTLDNSSSGADGVPEFDFRGIVCPLNFVRTKIELEKIASGDCIRVIVDGGEPAENVPRSAKLEGHLILESVDITDGVAITIQRKA